MLPKQAASSVRSYFVSALRSLFTLPRACCDGRAIVATTIFLVASPFGMAQSTNTTGQAGTLPDNTYRVKTVNIVDSIGFDRSLVALRAMIPSHWQSDGGVYWHQAKPDQRCGQNNPAIAWWAQSPDKQTGVQILPGEFMSSGFEPDRKPAPEPNTSPNTPVDACRDVRIQSVQVLLMSFIKHNRPGATLDTYRDRPDLAKQLSYLNNERSLDHGTISARVQGGEIRISYEIDEQAFEEIIQVAAIFQKTVLRVDDNSDLVSYSVSTTPGIAMRAPQGQLDPKLLELIRKSAVPQDDWSAKIIAHQHALARIRHASKIGVLRPPNILRRRPVRAYAASSLRRLREIQQAKQLRVVVGLYDVETRRTANGAAVRLPNTHPFVWQLPDSQYLLTDLPNFDPNAALNLQATKLELIP